MATTNKISVPTANPNVGMRMSPEARAAMRNTEKAMLRYYNDMGKNKGNCTWGIGFYAHKGVCTPEELERKVTAPSMEIEYAKRIAEAERRIKIKVKVKLNQAQFDGLVSFTYNTTNVTNNRIYQALNDNNFLAAAQRMSEANKVWVNGKWKLAPGLIKRREEESAPFRIATNRQSNTSD
ncbi:glycoside hydrolase family protein [Massilia niastensis]|uniref:glycoside hydrolase family protein n=1 Tax=Massilia niastensis TaxID=544911 RepID=UPI001E3DE536|nr:glycoside hydrolase family protein [Massilia niastensis]